MLLAHQGRTATRKSVEQLVCANAARWRKAAPDGSGTLGDAVLQSRGQFTQTYYIWLGALVLLAWTVLCNFLLMLAMTYLGREPPLPLSCYYCKPDGSILKTSRRL